MAYESNETGEWEVYLRTFPDGNGPWQASERGGSEPFWSRDGSLLYYSDSPQLTALEVDTGNGLRLGARQALFDRQDLQKICALPTDRGFLAIREVEREPHLKEVRVVLGWSAGLGH